MNKVKSTGASVLGNVGGAIGPDTGANNTVTIGSSSVRQGDVQTNVVRGKFGVAGAGNKGGVAALLSEGGINSFLSKIIHPGNYLHKHTYQLDITAPRDMLVARDLPIRCESITLPGTNVETSSDNLRKGPAREHAFNMNFGPVTGVFVCDQDQKERTFFHQWQQICVAGQEDGWGVGYFDRYATDMTITQFNMKGEPSFICKLFDCFPKSIGPETLSWTDAEIMKLSVEFAFHRWEQI